MAVVTFLIGNGFDLACGLKSKFTDTYNGYVSTESSSCIVSQFKKTIEKDIKSWADFEMRMAEYAKTFNNENELAECVEDYSAYLDSYLLQEQKDFNDSYEATEELARSLRMEIGDSLFNFYKGLTPKDTRAIASALSDGVRRQYRFICFNYTDIFEKLVSEVFSNGEINIFSERECISKPTLHIHGKLGEDLVLGVDNEFQMSGLPYELNSKGRRAIIKPVFLEEYDDYRKKQADSFIQESNVICVFGLSLGDSDLSWRNALAEWIEKDKNNHLVYYSHDLSSRTYLSSAAGRKMADEEHYKAWLIEKLFGEKNVEKDLAKTLNAQIHIPVGKTIFNINAAKYGAMVMKMKKQEINNTLKVQ